MPDYYHVTGSCKMVTFMITFYCLFPFVGKHDTVMQGI